MTKRTIKIYFEDSSRCDEFIDPESVDTIVTSPPYWGRRNYHDARQMGLEDTLEDYVESLSIDFGRSFKNVLKKTGSYFLNIGDNKKNGVIQQKPWKVMRRMCEDGWVLRDVLIWFAPNKISTSSKVSFNNKYEPIFWFTRTKGKINFFYEKVRSVHLSPDRYEKRTEMVGEVKKSNSKYNDPEVAKSFVGGCQYANKIKIDPEGGRCWNVWVLSVSSVKEAHSAPFPIKIPDIAIKSTCPKNGTVLDPFVGSGTTLIAAMNNGVNAIGFDTDLNTFKYMDKRIAFTQKRFGYEILFYGPHGLERYEDFVKRVKKWVK
ncbi:MAG: DNA-methyltransferase [Candidatus Helarchaeales archaeon]